MLKFDATHDFCRKTQNAGIPYEAAYSPPPQPLPPAGFSSHADYKHRVKKEARGLQREQRSEKQLRRSIHISFIRRLSCHQDTLHFTLVVLVCPEFSGFGAHSFQRLPLSLFICLSVCLSLSGNRSASLTRSLPILSLLVSLMLSLPVSHALFPSSLFPSLSPCLSLSLSLSLCFITVRRLSAELSLPCMTQKPHVSELNRNEPVGLTFLLSHLGFSADSCLICIFVVFRLAKFVSQLRATACDSVELVGRGE